MIFLKPEGHGSNLRTDENFFYNIKDSSLFSHLGDSFYSECFCPKEIHLWYSQRKTCFSSAGPAIEFSHIQIEWYLYLQPSSREKICELLWEFAYDMVHTFLLLLCQWIWKLGISVLQQIKFHKEAAISLTCWVDFIDLATKIHQIEAMKDPCQMPKE